MVKKFIFPLFVLDQLLPNQGIFPDKVVSILLCHKINPFTTCCIYLDSFFDRLNFKQLFTGAFVIYNI